MEFEAKNPDITSSEIKDFEYAWNVRLPEDYKQFLLKNNGGTVKHGQVVGYENSDSEMCRLILLEIYGITSPRIQLITPSIQEMTIAYEAGLPRNMFVLSRDGSNYRPMLMSVDYHNYGYIYTYDRQVEFGYDMADLIAKSFSELLSKVHDREQELLEEGREMLRQILEAKKDSDKDNP